jgi:uncharacterized UPF0160 family protein
MVEDVQGLQSPKEICIFSHQLQEFIEAIDAIDNGISPYTSQEQPKYRNRTDLSSRVGWLNPRWNESAEFQKVDVRAISSVVSHLTEPSRACLRQPPSWLGKSSLAGLNIMLMHGCLRVTWY